MTEPTDTTSTGSPSLQTLLDVLNRDIKGFEDILFGLTKNNAMVKGGNADWLDTPSGSWDTGRQSVAVPAAHQRLVKAIEDAISGAAYAVDIVSMDDLVDHSYKGSKPGFLTAINKAMVKLSESPGSPVRIRVLLGHPFPRPNFDLGFLSDVLMKDVKKRSNGNRLVELFIGLINFSSNKGWNHAKFIAVDGHTLITGGHNLWDKSYLGEYPVFDLSMRLQGPVAGAAHQFAKRMWEFVRVHNTHHGGEASRTYFISTNSVNSRDIRNSGQPWIMDPPASPTPGNLPVLWVANPGLGVYHNGDKYTNGSADRNALSTAMRSATDLCLVQQDLGAVAYFGLEGIPRSVEGEARFQGRQYVWWKHDLQPDQEHRFYIVTIARRPQGAYPFSDSYSSYDLNFINDLIGLLLRPGTAVEIVVTNLAGKNESGVGYSNGAPREHLVMLLYMMGSSRGLTAEIIRDKLSIRTIAINGGKFKWGNGYEIANHSKFWMVDGHLFYVGSENVYPTSGVQALKINAFHQEFGVVIDSQEIVDTVVYPYWLTPLLKNATPTIDVMNALKS